MVDWTKSMQQTFEYYIVDPNTWADVKPLTNVRSCDISRDLDVDTLGSASIDMTSDSNGLSKIGENYIRVYLITNQNGVTEKHPLGTFLIQTPSTNFNGKITNLLIDAYTPLLELKEKQPPLGYSLLKDSNIMDNAYLITREQCRAPVVKPECSKTLHNDFVSSDRDTWITFNQDLIANAEYEYSLDEISRILFSPIQDTASLQPVWTYDDDNSSILYPDIDMKHDLYKIPNVVEIIYSSGKDNYHARVVNDDPNSPTSITNRGREIVYREINPSLSGRPTEQQIKEYAENQLRKLSSLEYTITYTHGYCPVRIGDCVRLNYVRAGIVDVKAKVISQQIKCKPGCEVTEKAVFTKKLWG